MKIEGHCKVPAPTCLKAPLKIPNKLLMGPGPSNPSSLALEACSFPVLGHMHTDFFPIMDDVKAGLKYLFQTKNKWTLAVSGPGHLGMEAIICNLLEPGESIVVGVNGLWGQRICDISTRLGCNVHQLQKPLGEKFSKGEIAEALQLFRPKVLFLIHSESSSGVMQNLEGIGDLCQRFGTLFAVDTVASLGGVPFFMDDWKIDAAYTGTQKAIGSPPGMAPVSFGSRAVDKIKRRKTPIKSFILDMNLLANYWDCNDGEPRIYHHTPPVNIIYALRESLASIANERLENVWHRHASCTKRLYEGLVKMGLEFFVENEDDRLPTVTTLRIPNGIDWKLITKYAMDKYLVEIPGGLGPSIGQVIRIGILGHNAKPEKVDLVLKILKEAIDYARINTPK